VESFTVIGIKLIDLVQIVAGFALTMALLFGVTGERRFWPNLMFGVFAVQCLFFILFADGLNLKLLAGLTLISTVAARVLIRHFEAGGNS
jgi:hypothetical protein